MTDSITITVPGIPAPGGSKRVFIVQRTGYKPRAVVTDDAKRNKPWRESVAWHARDQYKGEPMVGPLFVSVWFTMPYRKGDRRKDGTLKPTAPEFHTVKPDATKLWRAAEDALTGILWHDDAAISRQDILKVYGNEPGLTLTLTRLAPDSRGEKK